MYWFLFILQTVPLEQCYDHINDSDLPIIPKVLHYVWVGNKPKPPEVVKCVQSWYKYCSDWLIVEWNDFSLQNINNTYIAEAYNAKKWAFVGDYIRIYALAMFGGVYVDADVELLQSIDSFLNASFFIGRENWYGYYNAGPHLMGAVPHTTILTDILAEYTTEHFLDGNGNPNYYVLPGRFQRYFQKHYDFQVADGADQTDVLNDTVYIYPWWYFCTRNEGKETYAIHHFHGSWKKEETENGTVEKEEQKDRKIEEGLTKEIIKKDMGKKKIWRIIGEFLMVLDIGLGVNRVGRYCIRKR